MQGHPPRVKRSTLDAARRTLFQGMAASAAVWALGACGGASDSHAVTADEREG